MSARRSMRRLVVDRRGLFPRPLTIYAKDVEDVSLGVSDFARALTNAESRNQRRRDGAWRGSGTEAELAGQPWRDQTERRTETRSSWKDYADAEDDAVNQRACKSVEGKSLAPQVGLEPTTLRLTATQPSWSRSKRSRKPLQSGTRTNRSTVPAAFAPSVAHTNDCWRAAIGLTFNQ